jgi:indolepyruvate ferredoxin oxidoreductase
MKHRSISLDDRYVLEQGDVLLSGVQALVRLPLDHARRDRRAGLNTAGFISGYRGSPLGGYDQQLARARRFLHEHHVHVEPGVNEDLAATAVWGSQQVNLHPGARYDGVFGIWYGKAPGLDRSGDVLKHANFTGTWRYGGVLAVAGDDPLGKSSTLPCQSEFAFADAEIPVLAPADVQDVLDLGLHGLALSRSSGLWVGMVAVADLMDGSATVNVDPARLSIVAPPDDGAERHITLAALKLQNRQALEERMRRQKLPAARLYARFNRLNRVVADTPAPRIGIAASGKAWTDLRETLDLLGIDDALAARIGLRLMKIAMPWPLEPETVKEFAEGLETILVVEAKRPLVETQLKELLFHMDAARRPRVLGKTDEHGAPLLPDVRDLTPADLAPVLLGLIPAELQTDRMHEAASRLAVRYEEASVEATASMRAPYFCSGCPHNGSTRVPDGSRAMAGIGCHIMAQWMGRAEDAYSQMGGEGVAWLGQAPFTDERHVFVNLGDGTYHHSGILAIRAAVAAGANVTYKLLYNDAVAMTGGQAVDGPLSVPQVTRQLAAEGVGRIVVVSEDPARYADGRDLAPSVAVHERGDLDAVQDELRAYEGVSVLVYDQTCAAEKRRRRKKQQYPDPQRRLFINDRVCEGCGDCSVQSNCLSVEPTLTPFGTKRAINQSSCNKDYSCAKGFCPSFVVVEGGSLRRPEVDLETILARAAELPASPTPSLDRSANLVLTGIGGTGVTTVSAILAMAGHVDGLEVASLDVTGLAQKGGAVMSFLRFAPPGRAIAGARLAPGEADALIASDLVVSAGRECLSLCDPARTRAVADSRIAPTAEFVQRQTESYRNDRLDARLRKAVRELAPFDVAGLAERLLGDAIYANMILAGAAFERGLLPLSRDAIEQAIRLNGIAADQNLAAFGAGRLLVADPAALGPAEPAAQTDEPEDLDALTARLAAELAAYQDRAYSERYLALVEPVRDAESALGMCDLNLTRAVATSFFKLMAYKDEYEVARLYVDPAFRARLERQFEGQARVSVQLAPPLLAPKDKASGRPRKLTFGPWIFKAFALLARLRFLRGTALDPFGRTEERRTERGLIERFERRITELLPELSPFTHEIALEIARLPEQIRGFGHVKAASLERARQAEIELLHRFEERRRIEAEMPELYALAAE